MAARTNLHLELAPDLASAAEARSAVRQALPTELSPRARDAVNLLVTELVTNAIVHVGEPVAVRLHAPKAEVIRVEVSDPSCAPPCPRDAGESTSGRGLAIVDALADRWGIDISGDGKSVWFELDVAAEPRD